MSWAIIEPTVKGENKWLTINPERGSSPQGGKKGVRRIRFLAGTLFFALGAIVDAIPYINEWTCEHSSTLTSCISIGLFAPSRLLFDYPFMAVGILLIVYSFRDAHEPMLNSEGVSR
jgi:hypothetical protein